MNQDLSRLIFDGREEHDFGDTWKWAIIWAIGILAMLTILIVLSLITLCKVSQNRITCQTVKERKPVPPFPCFKGPYPPSISCSRDSEFLG